MIINKFVHLISPLLFQLSHNFHLQFWINTFCKFVISQNLECCYSSWLTARAVHGSGLSGFRSGWTWPAIDQMCQMVTQNRPNSVGFRPIVLLDWLGSRVRKIYRLCVTQSHRRWSDQKRKKWREREREPQNPLQFTHSRVEQPVAQNLLHNRVTNSNTNDKIYYT